MLLYRKRTDPDSNGIVNGVGDGRSRLNKGRLRDSFCTERAMGFRLLHEDIIDLVRDGLNPRNATLPETIRDDEAVFHDKLFTEHITQSHDRTPLQLAFYDLGIEGLASIMGQDHLKNLYGAIIIVNLHHGHLSSIAIADIISVKALFSHPLYLFRVLTHVHRAFLEPKASWRMVIEHFPNLYS